MLVLLCHLLLLTVPLLLSLAVVVVVVVVCAVGVKDKSGTISSRFEADSLVSRLEKPAFLSLEPQSTSSSSPVSRLPSSCASIPLGLAPVRRAHVPFPYLSLRTLSTPSRGVLNAGFNRRA